MTCYPRRTNASGPRILAGIFSAVLSLGPAITTHATGWDSSAGAAAGLIGEVYAVAVVGTDVYIGGNFTTAGGVSRIAKWDGSSWSAVGGGVGCCQVNAMVVVGPDLYVGGNFTEAGGVTVNGIAKWDGSSWSALGTGTGDVRAIATVGSDLLVAGSFTSAGGTPANRIAKWDGSSWSALGSGVAGTARALAVSGTDVYVAGDFGVSHWDGTAWSAIAGADNTVGVIWALAILGPDLYAGGEFYLPDTITNDIKKWNGSEWSTVGSGPGNGITAFESPSGVRSLLVHDGALYIGGIMMKAGGIEVNGVVRYTGSAWLPLGEGVSGGTVNAMVFHGSDLHVAGSNSIVAKWTGSSAVCGDGTLAEEEEECDDGNPVDGDGCSSGCLAECEGGYTGVWVGPEGDELTILDDGTGELRGHFVYRDFPSLAFNLSGSILGRNAGGDGASIYGSNWGFTGYRRGCDQMDDATTFPVVPSAWTRVSTVVCGDGIQDPGEDCDLGEANLDDFCGDGEVEACTYTCRIPCEDGNSVDGDGCDSNCTFTACGNGVQTAGEACDDSNLRPDDGCNQNCQLTQCGDGVLTPGRAAFCDPGELCVDRCDDDWISPFGTPPMTDGEAYSVLVDGDDFYFGGYFLDGAFAAIAKWNNGAWKPLAKGFAGEASVYALAKFGSAVYAGGESLEDGQTGVMYGGIAAWDGSSWSPVGGGVSRTTGVPFVNAMLATDDALFVGGAFDHAGGAAAVGIARWDGTTWSAVGDLQTAGGEPGYATTLAEVGDDLYVGGLFESAGGVAASHVAKWDGTAWSALGEGFPQSVTAMLSDGSRLYVAGSGLIRVWDGATWETIWDGLASGSFGTVHGLVRIGGNVYAGGSFLEIEGATGVARWDGSAWTPLGSGVQSKFPEFDLPQIRGLFAEGNLLIAAGSFHRAGGKVGKGVAVWKESGCGEQCDDGNAANGDGCDANCRSTGCGNGIETAGEDCDDGNEENGDGCDANCTASACGNGIGTEGETCDDGNAVAGDGCENDCRLTPVSEVVPAGGSVSTTPASPQFPVQVAALSPSGGTISISEAGAPPVPSGFAVLGTALEIAAPPATVADPLQITMTVHLSAVPAGVDPQTLGVTRDGTPIEDCSGDPGQAVPDPCVAGRVVGAETVEITVLTSHASQWSTVLAGLDADDRKCVLGATKAATAVATTLLKSGAKCLKPAEAGDGDFGECVAFAGGAKAGKAMQKTVKAAARCPAGMPFGLAGTQVANLAGHAGGQALLADVLGEDVEGTIDEIPEGAECRRAAAASITKVLGNKLSLFLACESAGLAATPAPFVSSADIATCLDAVELDSDGKVGKAVAKLAKKLEACVPASVLPGVCSGAADAAACLEERVNCRLCRMLAEAVGFESDCDRFDDGLSNSSCP